MTELQVVIDNLKEAHIVGELLLAKLRNVQKDLEKPKDLVFPSRFIMISDPDRVDSFVIGLEKPFDWKGLPLTFRGRTAFSREDIQQIIEGLRTLLEREN